jgi:spermidine/putrescine transport system permease protein
MDDFVISQFLSSGTLTDTVPVRIYSQGRTAPTPALNALATLTLAFTLVVALAGYVLWKAVRASRGGRGSAVQEFATLDAEPLR